MLSADEAERHPLRNVITRALGGALTVVPDASEIDLREGDIFILCSDGLTGMVPEPEILRIVTENAGDLQAACEKLIDCANERGGYDNITAVLIKASETK
jgi:protein phosphatase